MRPKTWAVLLYLVERPGVLVTREELLDAVWPDVAVTPDTLTKSIGELRVALADDSKMPRYVETVHRRGFRFIATPSHAPATTAGVQEWSETATSPHPFVGREGEIRQLEERWTRAQSGERQLVFVTGPAGIGKTALVDRFLDSPAVRGAAPVWVGRGTCLEHHGPREAYMSVLEALERVARRPEAERVVEGLRRSAPTWLVQMPWLIDDDAEKLRRSLQTARAERMLREFIALIEALTAEIPLLLVLEDLHWSDPSTVDLLAFVAQRREPARLMILGTYRAVEAAVQDHPLAHAVRTLKMHRQGVELPMHDLTVEDVHRYLGARFPGAQFPPELANVIHAHTDGNPLFMVSVVDLLLSRGWILDTAPGWVLSAAPEKIDLGVPDDVQRMIEVQLQGLSPADRNLLEVASVAGLECAPPGLADALGCDAAEVEARCETLARANRFLRPAGSTEWPDGSVARRYAFAHELYRQVVYATIPDGRRLRLHQQIGESLESTYGERALEMAANLAAHFERSRDHRRAARYLVAAAARARLRFANCEALDYLVSALALVERLPDEHERLCRELEVRMALGPVLSHLHGYASEQVRENYERADVLSAQLGSLAEQFEVLYALCHFHTVRGNAVDADAMTRRLENVAEQVGTAEARMRADSVLVRFDVARGRFAEACRRMESRLVPDRGTVIAPPSDFGPDPVIAAVSHHALALWFRGYPERALHLARANLQAARASEMYFTLASALCLTGILELFCRNSDEALALAEEAALVSSEQGFAYWTAMAAAVRGAAWDRRGDGRASVEEIERARAALQATGARLFLTHTLAFLAEAHVRGGAIAAGLTAIEEALGLADTTNDRSYLPELWRLKGEILLAEAGARPSRSARGKRAASVADSAREAERCLMRALDLAREFEAKSLELRSAVSLARARHARGRSADGAKLLVPICKWFGSEAGGPDLAEARMVLDQLRTRA